MIVPTQIPIPTDPSLFDFKLATQGILSQSFSCSVSLIEIICCRVVLEDEASGTKAVGLGIGVRKD